MKCDGRIHDRKKLAGLFWELQSRARPHLWNGLGTASSVASRLDLARWGRSMCIRGVSSVLQETF